MLHLSKRAESFIKAASAPATICTLIAAVCDFFSAQGGWLILAIVGVLAILISTIICVYHNRTESRVHSLIVYLRNEQELAWALEGKSAIQYHAVHLLVFVGFSCIFVALQSHSSAKTGGVLASKIQVISDTQKALGLANALLDGQRMTNQKLDSLNDGIRETKRETSNNPRKELANLGVEWSMKGYIEAITHNDQLALKLFVDAGFDPANQTMSAIKVALQSDHSTISQTLLPNTSPRPNDECSRFFRDVVRTDNWKKYKTTPSSLALIRRACGNPEFTTLVKEQLNLAKTDYENDLKKYEHWENRSALTKKAADMAYQKCLSDAGSRVIFENIRCGEGLDPVQKPSGSQVHYWNEIYTVIN